MSTKELRGNGPWLIIELSLVVKNEYQDIYEF